MQKLSKHNHKNVTIQAINQTYRATVNLENWNLTHWEVLGRHTEAYKLCKHTACYRQVQTGLTIRNTKACKNLVNTQPQKRDNPSNQLDLQSHS